MSIVVECRGCGMRNRIAKDLSPLQIRDVIAGKIFQCRGCQRPSTFIRMHLPPNPPTQNDVIECNTCHARHRRTDIGSIPDDSLDVYEELNFFFCRRCRTSRKATWVRLGAASYVRSVLLSLPRPSMPSWPSWASRSSTASAASSAVPSAAPYSVPPAAILPTPSPSPASSAAAAIPARSDLLAGCIPMYPTPNCSICMTPLEEGSRPVLTPCGHSFHSSCLANAVAFFRGCPLCRDPRVGADA